MVENAFTVLQSDLKLEFFLPFLIISSCGKFESTIELLPFSFVLPTLLSCFPPYILSINVFSYHVFFPISISPYSSSSRSFLPPSFSSFVLSSVLFFHFPPFSFFRHVSQPSILKSPLLSHKPPSYYPHSQTYTAHDKYASDIQFAVQLFYPVTNILNRGILHFLSIKY